MRKILIDKTLENKAQDFCNNLFLKRSPNFTKPKDSLRILHDKLGKIKHKKHREYITKIINEYPDIITATPTKIKTLIKEFYAIDNGTILSQCVLNKKIKFYEEIIKAMRYEDLRESEFHSYIKSSGIKTCIYCNAQLTVVVNFSFYDKKEKKRKPKNMAKLELDHFYSKSKYPFLSTSFYNLYPVCGNCNRAKHDNEIDFELYTDDINELDKFKFWIDEESILSYWLSLNNEDLKVHFDSIDGNFDFINEYNKMFGIQGIYDTQIDIAEELVHKAKVYNDVYKKSLVESFKILFPDKSILDRLIVGNYADNSEIHKRPMAKYSQDIARQLKLI
ncbi:hypothetical protein [Flavobacterium reichenbachii]|uniref:HNH domain-containing protein n=1 Tax=Flavobacterium reichenbachii TaxID=362418 RepID=A0A085ZFZ1_9FLAO|nr:hypothetical protein [Flavobacterium reichenbachii]KFF03355.1 hypothetical protein IW19_20930 [Flavobacterium reichenbachii]OXB16721.1 hypothetical protein B0A68_06220 [Flavobacterium reichenbachii]